MNFGNNFGCPSTKATILPNCFETCSIWPKKGGQKLSYHREPIKEL